MRILFTGASSFSGFWFARELAMRGNEVVCPMTKCGVDDYSGIRRERVEILLNECGVRVVFSADIQSKNLREIILHERFDVFCNHAIASLNHKDPAYSLTKAISLALEGMDSLMSELRDNGCHVCVHSGTYFELGESVRSESGSFTPYAVAKSMLWEFIRYWANRLEMRLGKFVLPNPFGPYEERGLTTYLAKEWLSGRVPMLQTPQHTRDNMPIDVMAECYADFVGKVYSTGTLSVPMKIHPSGFVMKNSDWVKYLAEKLNATKLLNVSPVVENSQQIEAPVVTEPIVCHGIDKIGDLVASENFWHEYAKFFKSHYSKCGSSNNVSDEICKRS